MKFRSFDLNPMTLNDLLKSDLDIVNLYVHSQNEVHEEINKQIDRQTDRHIHMCTHMTGTRREFLVQHLSFD